VNKAKTTKAARSSQAANAKRHEPCVRIYRLGWCSWSSTSELSKPWPRPTEPCRSSAAFGRTTTNCSVYGCCAIGAPSFQPIYFHSTNLASYCFIIRSHFLIFVRLHFPPLVHTRRDLDSRPSPFAAHTSPIHPQNAGVASNMRTMDTPLPCPPHCEPSGQSDVETNLSPFRARHEDAPHPGEPRPLPSQKTGAPREA
jgi:hypothetical protein